MIVIQTEPLSQILKIQILRLPIYAFLLPFFFGNLNWNYKMMLDKAEHVQIQNGVI